MGFKNKVRIIGGKWRSQILRFPSAPLLRPSPDRLRVTLFNWLQTSVAGGECLDLFAGSGVLGLEALSRGAARTDWVENDPGTCEYLRQLRQHYALDACQVYMLDFKTFLQKSLPAYDLIFLDPPFHSGYIKTCIDLDIATTHLKPAGKIYLECHIHEQEYFLKNCELLKSKNFGEARAQLWRKLAQA